MTKSNKHIEIVHTTIKALSSMSQISCDAIETVLKKHFVSVRVSDIKHLSDLEALVVRNPDLVVLGMEFIPIETTLGQELLDCIWLSDFLDMHDIAYTGSNQLAHELERNKPLAKRRVLDAGLRTPAFQVLKRNQLFYSSDIRLTFPLFVKPCDRGGGVGIDSQSVVHNFDQLRLKTDIIFNKFETDALVEEYLPGREFSVAILKDDYSSELMALPIELVAPADRRGARLLSNLVKSSNSEQVLKVIDDDVKAKVSKLAVEAFYALGARDYGRIDIRLDTAGRPNFLEANLIPSLISGYGSFPKACDLNLGLKYEAMILRIVHLGLARSNNDNINVGVTMRDNLFLHSEVVFETI